MFMMAYTRTPTRTRAHTHSRCVMKIKAQTLYGSLKPATASDSVCFHEDADWIPIFFSASYSSELFGQTQWHALQQVKDAATCIDREPPASLRVAVITDNGDERVCPINIHVPQSNDCKPLLFFPKL